MEQDRKDAVLALIECSKPLSAISENLKKFPWDIQGDGVRLDRIHIVNILTRFLQRHLSAIDIEEWANLIEGRDDIAFEEDTWVAEVIYELANPCLTQPLTSERAAAIIAAMPVD